MREETLKLAKVKKSCKVTATVSQVLEIILIAATCICIVGAIICFCLNKDVNESIATISTQSEMKEFMNISNALDDVSIGGILKLTVHMEQLTAEGQYGIASGIVCLFGAVICGMTALVFDMIRRIFKTIRTSETPFSPEVLKGIRILSIIICAELLLMSGVGTAALAALISWSIYNILDYGFTIQQQIDETL